MLTIDYIQKHTNAKASKSDTADSSPSVLSYVDFDTRRIKENSLFVALTTGKKDGHLYINEAIQKGAKAILLSDESFVPKNTSDVSFLLVEDTLLALQSLATAYRLDLNVPVIAITGSNGKTTSKDLLSHLLSHKYKVHKTNGNFNNHIGVPLTLLGAKPEHDFIILEMGMNHAGELDLLGSISKPNYVIITNIGESHIEHLGSREGIAHAKGEVLAHLQEGGKAFIPYNCEFKELLASKTNEHIVYFKIGDENDNPYASLAIDVSKFDWDPEYSHVIAHSLEKTDEGTRFQYGFTCGDLVEAYQIPLFGKHNVANALPAIALAKEFGFTSFEIFEALKHIKISPMRFELVSNHHGVVIINDAYNASPTSMKTSAETFLNTFSNKRCVLVLGDMYELGENHVDMHSEVGDFLNLQCNRIEFLITVGEDSRYISGAFKNKKRHFDTKEEAMAFIRFFLHEDFALFFKASRGMKLESIIEHLT